MSKKCITRHTAMILQLNHEASFDFDLCAMTLKVMCVSQTWYLKLRTNTNHVAMLCFSRNFA